MNKPAVEVDAMVGAPAYAGIAFVTLFRKELLRFCKVSFQTIAAPVLTALLYLLIFGRVLADHAPLYGQISYTAFLVPGLIMMSMLQNAFANSSSSLIQSKVTGSIVFVLLPPLSYVELFAAYVAASVVRGLAVGLGVFAITLPFGAFDLVHPFWVAAFALTGCTMLGAMGVIAGIWAEKFDQLAAFQNFAIVPLTFLAGVFYSIHALPPFWRGVSQLNPFFYLIDGFRYGFYGVSDVAPVWSLAVAAIFLATLTALTLSLLRSGYRLRY